MNVSSPVILTAEPLNELSILKDGQFIYQKLATSTEAIETPFTWPLPPLRGGERLTLKLRPRGAAGGNSAQIPLLVASAGELQRNNLTLNRLRYSQESENAFRVTREKITTELLTQLIFTNASDQQDSQDSHSLSEKVKTACGIER